MVAPTLVRVKARRNDWQVIADGLPIDEFAVKQTAIAEARAVAREASPHARLEVQNRLTGTYRTEATY